MFCSLLSILLTFNVLTLLCVSICAEDEPIVLKLRPKQIVDTFQSVVGSDYLRTLAKDFAKKAAEHLISEMRNQEKDAAIRPPEKKQMLHNVLTLLRDPSPDGDNLEVELPLSDEEKTTPPQPVKPMKINGAYF